MFRSLGAAALVPAALACFLTPAMAQETREVSGSATYLQRMALPDNAELVVEATGFRGALLAVTRTQTEGKQVPLPFSLDLPQGFAADLQVAISVEGQVNWASEGVSVPAGTDNVDVGEIRLNPHTPSGFQSQFTCGERTFSVGFSEDKAILETDDRIYELPQAVSASGARFASDDGKTVFWNKGDKAWITLDGEELPECQLVRPEAESWSAQGNEPGWKAVISEDRLKLDLSYGQDRLDLALPQPDLGDGAYIYTFPAFGLGLTVSDGLCQDSMSGRLYPQSVTVTTATDTLNGCGGDTLALLGGEEWKVTGLAGKSVPEDAGLTLSVSEEGHVSGSAGCNRYMGMLSVSGEGGLEWGQLASTNMACEAAAMKREAAYLKALTSADRFQIGENGDLEFYAGDKLVVTATR